MTKTFKEHFIGERAKALATMVLSRREGVQIVEAKDDPGLDYLVYIADEVGEAKRPFGVVLRATMTPVTVAAANAYLKPVVAAFSRLGQSLYPVFLMYFTIKNDKGYYTWLQEPVVNAEGKPKLLRREDPDCREIGTETMGEIVEMIDGWYDALCVELTS